MIKAFIFSAICFVLTQTVSAQWQLTEAQQREIAAQPNFTRAQLVERMAIITNVNHSSLTLRAANAERIVAEANYFATRLKLPISRPFQINDVEHISSLWFCVLQQTNPPYFPDTIFGTNIFDSNIPREKRLRALKIAASGTIRTPDFFFSIFRGRLIDVMRLTKGEPDVEYYAHDLGKLVDKPSLINKAQAFQLATQWLAAVDMDVEALERQFPHSVNQLSYSPPGATNAVLLPLYFVGLGTNDGPHGGNMPITYDPAVEVEILGTTKELQELRIGRNKLIGDIPYDHRPLLLISNALDLIRTPNPPVKQLQNPFNTDAKPN